MMNYIWVGLIVISIVCAVLTGRVEQLSQGIVDASGQAVEIIIATVGLMCLWLGIMKVAEESGLTRLLARLFSPILRRLFKEYKNDSEVLEAISMNLSANLLGIGNAATPFGLKAMEKMQQRQPEHLKNTADNSMVMFVVLNNSCLQLVPTMLISLRVKYGSENAFDVLPVIWLATLVSLTVGIIMCKIFESRGRN